jgi:hypothetical protein
MVRTAADIVGQPLYRERLFSWGPAPSEGNSGKLFSREEEGPYNGRRRDDPLNKKTPGLDTIHDLFATRLPILIWVSMVYVGTVILQFLNEPLILQACVFTGLFTVHVLLHWNVYRVTAKQYWFYFSIQAVLIYLCAILMPGGYQVVLIGLLPVMIAQSLGFSFRLKRILFVSVISLFLFFDAALTIHDTGELIVFLPLFALMLIIVIAYGILFFRQVQERLRIQSFLHELEEAHSKVEELTLSNERQDDHAAGGCGCPHDPGERGAGPGDCQTSPAAGAADLGRSAESD